MILMGIVYHTGLVICKGAGGFDIPGYTFPLASDTFSINPISGDCFGKHPYYKENTMWLL